MNKSLNKALSVSLVALLLVGCSSSTNSNDSSTGSDTSSSEPSGKEYDENGNEITSDSSDESESADAKEKDATYVDSDTDEKVAISAEGPDKADIEVSDIYPGMATGKNGDLYVMVNYSNGKITNVEVSNHSEDDSRSEVSEALTKIPEEIVSSNSTDVDVVSGATETSQAIIDAVASAISRAE